MDIYNNTVARNNSIITGVYQIGGGLLGFMFFISISGTNSSPILFDLLLFACSVALIVLGIRNIMFRQKLKAYLLAMSGQPCLSIAEMAYYLNRPGYKVRRNLRDLIYTGFFVNNASFFVNDVGINEEGTHLILGNSISANAIIDPSLDENDYTDSIPAEPCPPKVIVTCNNCGAKNVIIKEQISECEYCGSLLQK